MAPHPGGEQDRLVRRGIKLAEGPREVIRNDVAVIAAYLGETEDEAIEEIERIPEGVER